MFSCKRRCATFAKYSQEPIVQFSTIVFCVQELSSPAIAKRNKQEGFLMMCPNQKKSIMVFQQ